jgi:hypothetical protein
MAIENLDVDRRALATTTAEIPRDSLGPDLIRPRDRPALLSDPNLPLTGRSSTPPASVMRKSVMLRTEMHRIRIRSIKTGANRWHVPFHRSFGHRRAQPSWVMPGL